MNVSVSWNVLGLHSTQASPTFLYLVGGVGQRGKGAKAMSHAVWRAYALAVRLAR